MDHSIRVKDRDIIDNNIKYPCVCRHKHTGTLMVFIDEESGFYLPSQEGKAKGNKPGVFKSGWRAYEINLERLRNVKLTLEF